MSAQCLLARQRMPMISFSCDRVDRLGMTCLITQLCSAPIYIWNSILLNISNPDCNVFLMGYLWPSVNNILTCLPALCVLAIILATIKILRRCVRLRKIWTDVLIVFHQNFDTVVPTQNIGYSKLTVWLLMGLHIGISIIQQSRSFGVHEVNALMYFQRRVAAAK